jgi:hypothetical protein
VSVDPFTIADCGDDRGLPDRLQPKKQVSPDPLKASSLPTPLPYHLLDLGRVLLVYTQNYWKRQIFLILSFVIIGFEVHKVRWRTGDMYLRPS